MRDWFEKKDEFGIGKNSWATLRAIQGKLSVQYRPLIGRLSQRFSVVQGPMSTVLDELEGLVSDALDRIQVALNSGHISLDDQRRVLTSIGRIEHLLAVLSEHEKEDATFSQALQEVSQELGITLKDLTVSRGLVAKGLRAAGQSRSGRMTKQIKGGMKQGFSDILSAVSSVAGPFAPVANLALRGASAALGGGARAAFGGNKAQTGQTSSRTRSWNDRGPGEGQDFVQAMRQFYNTDAYKVRWTRELLDTVKAGIQPLGAEKKNIFGTIGDAVRDIGLLGVAAQGLNGVWNLLPKVVQDVVAKLGASVGTLAKLSGVLLASYWTIQQWKQLWDALVDREKARENARKVAAELTKSQNTLINKLGAMPPAQREQTLKGLGKTQRQLAIEVAGNERRETMQSNANAPWYTQNWGPLNPILRSEFGGREKTKLSPWKDHVAQVEKRMTAHPYQRMQMPARYEQQYPETWKRVTEKLDEINKTLKANQKTTVPFSGTGGPRNSYDSSDSFADQFLRSYINFGER